MIMGALFFRMTFTRAAVFGILIGLVGTVILMLSRSHGNFGAVNWYALLIVLACAFYGFNLNFIKFNITTLGSLTITSVSVCPRWTAGRNLPFGFRFHAYPEPCTGAWTALGYIALLALMSTAVAVTIFNKLVKMTTPLFASSVTYIMPLVSVMWGVLDHEQLYVGHFIGMAAILAGVYIANRKWS